MDSAWILSFGLDIVGFWAARQNVSDKLNLKRFRSHYGIGPGAIMAIATDMRIDFKNNKKSAKEMKYILIALCWLKLYETEHVMAGRWGFGEEFCRDMVRSTVQRLQSLMKKKIRFQ
jgi:hypothetical protein